MAQTVWTETICDRCGTGTLDRVVGEFSVFTLPRGWADMQTKRFYEGETPTGRHILCKNCKDAFNEWMKPAKDGEIKGDA